MRILRFAVWTLGIGLTMLGTGGALAQNYPSKTVRILTNPVGGGNDFIARLIATGLSDPLGQSVIVDNRSATDLPVIMSKASPDGYTLLVAGGTFWTFPLLQKASYDPVRDYAPITATTSSPSVLVVHPSVPARSVKELIALAKGRPGELNCSATTLGSSSHLAAELFKSMAGVNIVSIPYKGSGPALTDLIGGQVQLTFGSAAPLIPFVKTGRLRALAVTSAQASALFPGLPAVAATVPGYEAVGMTGMFAPARTTEAIIKHLNQEIVRVLNQADVKEKLLNSGQEVVGSTPEQFAAYIKSEIVILSKVIKDAGIKIE